MQFKPCCAVSGKKKHQYLTHSVSESCQTTAAYIHGLFLHFMRFEISKAMLITSVFAFNKQKICDKTDKNIVCCCLALSRSRAAYIHQHFSIRSMQDTSICSVSCLPLFLDVAFPKQCYLRCFCIPTFKNWVGSIFVRSHKRRCNWPAWYVPFGLTSAGSCSLRQLSDFSDTFWMVLV